MSDDAHSRWDQDVQLALKALQRAVRKAYADGTAVIPSAAGRTSELKAAVLECISKPTPGHEATAPGPFTAITEQDGDVFTSICPELDIRAQGIAPEESRELLLAAVRSFLATATEEEIKRRAKPKVLVADLDVQVA